MDLTRRSILKILAFTPLAGQFYKTSIARPLFNNCMMNRFFIAGFQFYDGPSIINKLKINGELLLVTENKNIHDKYAVAIYHKKKKIGYVPRTDNRHISRLLNQEINVACKITEVNPKHDTWKMVRVEISLVV